MFNLKKTTLVLCRYKESLDWLEKINSNIDIIIYNKGDELNLPYPSASNNFTVINIANIGREEFVYLKYIIDYYHSLPDIIIFSQADPFLHSPDFINIINNRINEFLDIQPLTIGYSKQNPPQIFRDISSKYMSIGHIEFFNNNFDKLIGNEKIIRSGGHNWVYSKISKFLSTTMVRDKIMEFIGIIPRNFNNMSISPLCYCAIFSVTKNSVLQHDINTYRKLLELSITTSINNDIKIFAYLMEFAWMEFFNYEPPIELLPYEI